MGKLTIEQAKKFMEAAKNAETNPIDDKFYPESKITTADKIDTGEPKNLPSKKKMPGIKQKIKTLIKKTQDFSDKTNQYFGIGGNKEDIKRRNSGSKKAEKKKMPKARDMAMGNKNIVYLGDPYIVDGKMYDPVKEHPEDYIRPKGAKNYSKGSKKPIKAVGGILAASALGIPLGISAAVVGAKKLKKKASATATSNDGENYAMNNKKPIMDLYQKTVKSKTATMSMGGEVEVVKGGDYIKDLID